MKHLESLIETRFVFVFVLVSYIDRTGDLQTAAMVASYACEGASPSVADNKTRAASGSGSGSGDTTTTLKRWIDTYRYFYILYDSIHTQSHMWCLQVVIEPLADVD